MKVLYPGSFNPWHNGHQHVYEEACSIFGKENVIIGIAQNSSKQNNNSEFIKWTLNAVAPAENIVVIETLVADYCKEHDIERIVRGIRQGYDLEQEEKLSYWNNKLGEVKTLYIPTTIELNQLSSSALREFRQYKNYNFFKDYIPEHVSGRWYFNKELCYNNIIFFGKSCIGKTTYHNSNAVNVDKVIWDCVGGIINIEEWKISFRKAIKNKDDEQYNILIDLACRSIDWAKLFSMGCVFDFPTIGRYFKYIPDEIKYRYNYIKLVTTEEKREERIKSRGVDKEWIECLDHFYMDCELWDSTIEI